MTRANTQKKKKKKRKEKKRKNLRKEWDKLVVPGAYKRNQQPNKLQTRTFSAQKRTQNKNQYE